MKLDRMLAITLELMSKKRVRASELAARFEVSTRTIYREIELINQAGIPVTSFTGADGGFELMDGFFITKQHFSLQDLSDIYQLIQSVEGAVGGRFTTLKHKLSSLQPRLSNEELMSNIVIDISTPEKEKDTIRKISQSIDRSKIIGFTYMSASGSVKERKAEPVKLYWEHGIWYLEAFCLSHHAERLFRVSRISQLQMLEESRPPRRTHPANEEQPTGIQAKLRFEQTADPRVSEQFPGEYRYEDNYIEVNTTFYTMEYAVSVVLSYGAKVSILSPPELRDAMLKTLYDIQKKY